MSIKSKTSNAAFRDGYDRVFGKKGVDNWAYGKNISEIQAINKTARMFGVSPEEISKARELWKGVQWSMN